MLLSDPPLILMCDLGGRIARWMGGLNTAAEALIGQTNVASTHMSAFEGKADIFAKIRFCGRYMSEPIQLKRLGPI